MALVVLAALLIPLVALSASNDWNWWFSRVYTSTTAPVGTVPQSPGTSSRVGPGGPAPAPLAGGPTTVETGTWDGKSWVLVAYLSKTDGVCFSVSPTETAHTNGRGAAMNCDQIAGVPRTPDSKPYTAHSITYLSGGSTPLLPGYVAGMVVDSAARVDVYLPTGEVLHADTVPAPTQLGTIHFYAAQLPATTPKPPGDTSSVFEKLVGLDKDGNIVACFGAC